MAKARNGDPRGDEGKTTAGLETRTELLWPGKYAGSGVLADASPEPARLEISEICAPGEGYRNLLILGDNLGALDAIADRFAGRVDLAYIDPPFATGLEHSVRSRIGEGDPSSRRIRAQPAVRERAYGDSWGRDPGAYLAMLAPRLRRIRSLLAPEGSLFVHLDRRVAHHVKLLLDEIFGRERCVNEIVWCYTGPSSPGMRGFANKHDLIFWYSKGERWTFNVDAVRLPYKESTRRNEGRRTGFTTGNPDLVVRLHPLGKYPEDWWVLPVEAPASRNRTGYPTQKPERLLERILLAASREGSLVADFFCGSGTALAVAERHGRRWIGCDSSRFAIQTARKRLLGIPSVRPFEVAHLERPHAPRLGETPSHGAPILDAGGVELAERLSSLQGGRRGPVVVCLAGDEDAALLAVGRAVGSAPSAEGCRLQEGGSGDSRCDRGKREGPTFVALHVVRRRWEPRLLQRARAVARERGVVLVAVEAWDDEAGSAKAPPRGIPFREVPEVEASVSQDAAGRTVVSLLEVLRHAPDLLPPGAATEKGRWSDLVDAWAVDWDWQGGPVSAGFYAFRTPRQRALPLQTPPHAHSRPGSREILVKVWDVLGVESYRILSVPPRKACASASRS